MTSKRTAESDSTPAWSHLPPVDASVLLKVNKKGAIKAVEKLPTPVDEFGIPDGKTALELALSTLDAGHQFPRRYNRHHLVYPRVQYHEHTSGSEIPKLFRESKFLIWHYPQQLHNYWHEIYEDPIEPDFDVMYECVREQSEIDMLFCVGQTAIQLHRMRFADETDDITRRQLRMNALRDSRQCKAIFYDLLHSYPQSQIGILPDRQQLADMPFGNAIRALGTLAGSRSLDARRETHTLLTRVGISNTANIA
jgi:hypothetical protein